MGRPGSSAAIRRPPKAAPPSRRVWPPASIALDRDPGQPLARRPRSVAGWGRAFGACCFAGKLRSPAGSGPGTTLAEAVDPYASRYASPYASPYAGHPRTPSPSGGRITAGHAPVGGPVGRKNRGRLAPLRGSGAAAPGGALRAIDPSARPRSWRTCGPRRLRRQSQRAVVATQSDRYEQAVGADADPHWIPMRLLVCVCVRRGLPTPSCFPCWPHRRCWSAGWSRPPLGTGPREPCPSPCSSVR
jgi:hypothetical protein